MDDKIKNLIEVTSLTIGLLVILGVTWIWLRQKLLNSGRKDTHSRTLDILESADLTPEERQKVRRALIRKIEDVRETEKVAADTKPLDEIDAIALLQKDRRRK